MRSARTWLWIIAAALLVAMAAMVLRSLPGRRPEPMRLPAEAISLPAPRHDGTMSLEMALQHRRSERDFSDDPCRTCTCRRRRLISARWLLALLRMPG
jgi:hypothetical protein